MILEFLFTTAVVVLLPGAGVMYTISIGLGLGRWASFLATLGCTFGVLPHIIISVTGISALILANPWLFDLLRYAGAFYLFYMGVSLFFQKNFCLPAGKIKKTSYQIVRDGFLLNILNPKLSLFFVAFLPQFVGSEVQNSSLIMFEYGLIYMVITVVIFILYGFFAAQAGLYLVNNRRARLVVRYFFSLSFLAFGFRMAFK